MPRKRIHELAKEWGMETRQLLDKLEEVLQLFEADRKRGEKLREALKPIFHLVFLFSGPAAEGAALVSTGDHLRGR